ncbi:sensor histidine kinase [Microbacterium sp.]|uniref:sensor histidine kinase n=1 Tax=Microbacterium sp. TaxID=51671 RepID=UPI0039E6B519
MTVAVLTLGLFAAGVGTMVFLRNAQEAALDDQLRSLVSNDVTSSLLDVSVDDGVPSFRLKQTAAPTQFQVAVYDAAGNLLATAGGSAGATAAFPETFPLATTVSRGVEPFALDATEGDTTFRASVDTLQVPGARDLLTQLVALPLAPVNQTVGTYIGIYTILALLTVLAAALTTRGIVTLTFRGLGQVEQTAMSIAAGDFGQRMSDISPGTEVGRLKSAINAMLDRVDGAIAQRDTTVQHMRRFIGDASHELRTPLVTVRGYAELYRMGAISGEEQTAQAMTRIEKEATRMGALVEDLLALARLDERRGLAVAPVDLRLIASDAALDARAAAPERSVTVVDLPHAFGSPAPAPVPRTIAAAEPARRGRATPTTGFAAARLSLLRRRPRPVVVSAGHEPAPPPAAAAAPEEQPSPIVLGDENRIRQVVANLLGNARRYSPPDSPIELAVGVDREAGAGWIAVIDHGEGIPEQIREQIFQRFWRADTSRTRETGGSGLGLSIVASIVEALHGSIDVGDTPGGGATFRVAFPLAQERDADEHLHIETRPMPRVRGAEL